jgi:hypothetical protein
MLFSAVVLKEVYNKKIIIEANAGSENAEMGIEKAKCSAGELCEDRGPCGIYVDRQGVIYVFDAVNWKMLKYDRNGQFDRMFKPARIDVKVKKDCGFIGGCKFSGNGQGDSLLVDSNAVAYINVAGYYDGYLIVDMKADASRIGVIKYDKTMPAKIIQSDGYVEGKIDNLFISYFQRKTNAQYHILPGFYPSGNNKFMAQGKEVKDGIVVTVGDKVERVMQAVGSPIVFLLAEDLYGNIYILKMGKENKVVKYDLKGNLIGEITGLSKSTFPFVAWNGDIYQLDWDIDKRENGIKVIKWEKQNTK